jgi:hypothetical protein
MVSPIVTTPTIAPEGRTEPSSRAIGICQQVLYSFRREHAR